jgi:hypothetical protein
MVIKAGKKYELVAKNELGGGTGEIFRSSLGVVDDELLIRSDRTLYRLR